MRIISTKKCNIAKILGLLQGRQSKSEDVEESVLNIMQRVKTGGDSALFDLTNKFDGIKLKSLQISRDEIENAYRIVDKNVLKSIKLAKRNIEKFHKKTIRKKELPVETSKGVRVWREFRPIEKVGLYVPGGTAAYPSTVLMLAVPAQIAGCEEVIMCAPVDSLGSQGEINPAVLVAADLCGVKKIFKIGGAQAIAAMAYGTGSVPKVYKIFGPGNQYVTTAKMLAYGDVDIDMPAGPSEVCVIADESANPDWVAADLLSQLEHGTDSQAILITFSEKTAVRIAEAMQAQAKTLPRKNIIRESIKRSFAIIVRSVDEACKIANEYAPEHLEIVTKCDARILKNIKNAGSVFLGEYTSEPLGDYATGANHTLPTSGFAKMFSPLSTESFGKMIQIQKVSKEGIGNLRKTVEILASSEGLLAHKNAISIRFNNLKR